MAEPRLPRVMFQVDPKVPPGDIHVGGPLVLDDPSDDELGFAATAKLVRAHDETMLMEVISRVCTDCGAVELKLLPPIEEEPF